MSRPWSTCDPEQKGDFQSLKGMAICKCWQLLTYTVYFLGSWGRFPYLEVQPILAVRVNTIGIVSKWYTKPSNFYLLLSIFKIAMLEYPMLCPCIPPFWHVPRRTPTFCNISSAGSCCQVAKKASEPPRNGWAKGSSAQILEEIWIFASKHKTSRTNYPWCPPWMNRTLGLLIIGRVPSSSNWSLWGRCWPAIVRFSHSPWINLCG